MPFLHDDSEEMRGEDQRDVAGDARLGLSSAERQLADALAGGADALATLARRDAGAELARRHRAGAALYLRAERHGLSRPATPAVAAWYRELLAGAAYHLRTRRTVQEVAARLAPAGIEWVPFKGFDLATRVYAAPEERPAADLDLLIRPEHLDEARRLLQADGWRDIFTGPHNEAFVKEEGYAWLASKPGRTFLELHFRLWGLVPEGLAAALYERSRPDGALPDGGRRPALADAYLVAAVHAWLTPPPRPLLSWWDLARISASLAPREIDEAVREARAWDLQLLVVLAAEVSAALWRQEACREIRRRLAGHLRAPERWLAARARRRGLVRLPLARLQAARLLTGRRSRQGWRGAWRRIWPHPGIVERATPDEWPWIRRRLWYQLRQLGGLRS